VLAHLLSTSSSSSYPSSLPRVHPHDDRLCLHQHPPGRFGKANNSHKLKCPYVISTAATLKIWANNQSLCLSNSDMLVTLKQITQPTLTQQCGAHDLRCTPGPVQLDLSSQVSHLPKQLDATEDSTLTIIANSWVLLGRSNTYAGRQCDRVRGWVDEW